MLIKQTEKFAPDNQIFASEHRWDQGPVWWDGN
jgi:hypothetical protein